MEVTNIVEIDADEFWGLLYAELVNQLDSGPPQDGTLPDSVEIGLSRPAVDDQSSCQLALDDDVQGRCVFVG